MAVNIDLLLERYKKEINKFKAFLSLIDDRIAFLKSNIKMVDYQIDTMLHKFDIAFLQETKLIKELKLLQSNNQIKDEHLEIIKHIIQELENN